MSELELNLLSTIDAHVWATEFCKINPVANFDVMVGWFANAITAGEVFGRKSFISKIPNNHIPDVKKMVEHSEDKLDIVSYSVFPNDSKKLKPVEDTINGWEAEKELNHIPDVGKTISIPENPDNLIEHYHYLKNYCKEKGLDCIYHNEVIKAHPTCLVCGQPRAKKLKPIEEIGMIECKLCDGQNFITKVIEFFDFNHERIDSFYKEEMISCPECKNKNHISKEGKMVDHSWRTIKNEGGYQLEELQNPVDVDCIGKQILINRPRGIANVGTLEDIFGGLVGYVKVGSKKTRDLGFFSEENIYETYLLEDLERFPYVEYSDRRNNDNEAFKATVERAFQEVAELEGKE